MSPPKLKLPKSGERVRPGKLLIVDDNVQFARSIRRALETEHEVTIAMFATDALRRLADGRRFDVILVDLDMPGVGFVELYERVRAGFPDQAARIVMMTNGALDSPTRAFVGHVPNVIVERPVDVDLLRALLDERVMRVGARPPKMHDGRRS